MKADPSRQRALLEVQVLDTTLAQLDHRRTTLPEHTRLRELSEQQEVAQSEVVRTVTAHEDVQRELRKADADVQLVRDRVARDQARLDLGVGSAKDLQGIQHELQSLARRQAILEDEELEVMERAESAEQAVGRARQQEAEITEQVELVTSQRDDKQADIAMERERVVAARAPVVELVGNDLLALYDKIRARSGSGAAPLVARRCNGCNMELHNTDLSRIREAADDEVLRCEECGRILVRTEESGL
ncbi:MAG: C4-type zinc ribbon domain-containing protein [Ornithinimicrobium sp.]